MHSLFFFDHTNLENACVPAVSRHCFDWLLQFSELLKADKTDTPHLRQRLNFCALAGSVVQLEANYCQTIFFALPHRRADLSYSQQQNYTE